MCSGLKQTLLQIESLNYIDFHLNLAGLGVNIDKTLFIYLIEDISL